MSLVPKPLSVRFDRPVKDIRLDGNAAAPTVKQVSPPSTARNHAQPNANDPARAQQVEELFSQLYERLGQLESSRSESLAVIHQIAIELSVAIAGKILFSEIEKDQFPIREMADELLGMADPSEPVTVFLNPADLSLLKETRGKNESPDKSSDQVKWLAGPELKRGCARMDLSRYSLFYDGVLQLNEIRQSLLEMANDAEIERRKSGGGSAGLRRFPDRRASG